MTIIWRKRFACWITKAADIPSEYVILIAFQLQQWLRERGSILGLYINCLSCFIPSWCPTAAMLLSLSNVSSNSIISNSNHFTFPHNLSLSFRMCIIFSKHNYQAADKSLVRPTYRRILFVGENISFYANLVMYINSTSIPQIMVINRIYEYQILLNYTLITNFMH
jgi:hypothetical protein